MTTRPAWMYEAYTPPGVYERELADRERAAAAAEEADQ